MKRNYPLHELRSLLWTLAGPLLLLSACGERPIGASEEGTHTPSPPEPVRTLDSLPSLGPAPKKAFSFDLKVRAENADGGKRFKANMRMEPDSIIWGSVAPLFGIEVGRVLLNDDSLHFLDRANDRFFQGEPERFGMRYGIPLERRILESTLLGRPVLSHDEGFLHFEGEGDSAHYEPVMDSTLRELIGLQGYQDPYDSSELPSSKMGPADSLLRYMKKRSDTPRFLPFYWTADSGELLSRFTVIDLEERSVLDIRYEKHQSFQGARIPERILVKLRSSKGISTFELRIEKATVSESLSYPFNVPDGYERIRP